MAARAERQAYKRHDTRDPSERLVLHTAARSFRTIVTEHPDDPDNPMISVSIRQPVGMMELTVMTSEEIEALRVWFNESLDLAKVVTVALDERAAEAAANGDLTFKRLYRQSPQYMRFPNPKENPNDNPQAS